MAETDVKCVKLKSDQRSIYRMNQFYWIHCYQHQKRKKSLTCHEEKWGSRGSLCLVARMSRACRGRHGEVGIMEFGLHQQ